MTRILTAFILAILLANPAWSANQSVKTKPDGKIVFAAALSGVTRLSIRGDDRIKELWSTNSAFEAELNGDTGDMFMRYVGTGRPKSEDGFLVTEKGYTINYTLRPKDTTSETVLIGLEPPEAKASPVSEPVAFKATSGASSGDGYSGQIVSFVKSVYAEHMDGRAVPRVKTGKVVRTLNGQGFRGRLTVAVAGAQGGAVQAQSFYRKGVLAVFLDKPVLAAGQRTWVLVVEGR